MSPEDALRKTIVGLEAALRDARAALAALQVGEPAQEGDRLVEHGAALAITKLSSSTLYRIAPRFGLGFQLPSGAWRFYEARLRAYVAPKCARGEFGEARGEFGEARGIHIGRRARILESEPQGIDE